MANSVMNWVWDHSRSRHAARLVLLALADRAREDGSAWPSNTELRRMTGLGERAVQTAVIQLAKLGELEVGYQQGPKGCNRYRVLMTPADSAPPQSLRGGADSAPPQDERGVDESPQASDRNPANSAPPADSAPPQNPARDPANFADGTLREPKNSPTESSKDIAADPGALFDAPPPKPSGRKPAAKQPPATRIPDDFAVTADMRDWAARSIPGYDVDGETENFIDWWRSKPGTAATKVDWSATWRTWMRKNAKETPQPPRNGGKPVGSGSGNGQGSGAPGPARARGWIEAGRAYQAQVDQAGRELPSGR